MVSCFQKNRTKEKYKLSRLNRRRHNRLGGYQLVDIHRLVVGQRHVRQNGCRSSDQMGGGTLHPGTAFLFRGVQNALGPLQRFDVQVGDVGVPVGAVAGAPGKLDADLELVVEHHLVLPQTALTVKHAEHALLGLDAAAGAAPGLRVAVPITPSFRHGALRDGIVGAQSDTAAALGRLLGKALR